MEWIKIIGLSIIMIAIGYFVLRIIAKRSFTEMSIFNIFLVLMLANILSEPIRTDNFAELIIPTLIIVFTFLGYSYLLSTNRIGKNLKSDPIVLIRHGNIDEKALAKAKMTISEMLAELRIKGYTHIQDVEFAILEELGRISVIPNAGKRPVNTSDLSIVTGYEGLPVPLIVDGGIQFDNLANIKLRPEDLQNRLGMMGYNPEMIKTIALATLDENHNIIIDQNDDTNQGNVEQNQQSIVKKIQEDLKSEKKSPDEQDIGLVDNYIKP